MGARGEGGLSEEEYSKEFELMKSIRLRKSVSANRVTDAAQAAWDAARGPDKAAAAKAYWDAVADAPIKIKPLPAFESDSASEAWAKKMLDQAEQTNGPRQFQAP